MTGRGLALSVSVSFLFFATGCMEPSVRYKRDENGNMHMIVPRNWDYRSHYHAPKDRLTKIAESYIGTRYKSGGMSRQGFDCSGFVCVVFRELNKAALPRMPRSSKELWNLGETVSEADARPGDLVFFRGGFWGGINHVGIFMGDKSFIHASKSSGVMYDNLDEEYYQKHFAGFRRIF